MAINSGLHFSWQFGLFSISIGYYRSPCGRCWVIVAYPVKLLLIKTTNWKPHFKSDNF